MKEFYITLLKIIWETIPRFTKIAALILFVEMIILVLAVGPQNRFGIIIGLMFMLPFILFVFLMSIIER